MSNSPTRCIFAVLFLGLLIPPPAAWAGVDRLVTIVTNPGAFGYIEKAAVSERQVNWWDEDQSDDNACTESFAAVELRHLLTSCSKYKEKDIKLAQSARMPSTGHVFLLGTRQSNSLIDSVKAPAEKRIDMISPESFHIRSFRQGMRTITIIEGRGRVGVLYGVYAYLEKLGMGFFGLDHQGTVYPKKPGDLPTDLNLTENPHYITRGFFISQDLGDEPFFLWMARNRLNYWTADVKKYHFLKKLGMKLTIGHHDIQKRFINFSNEYPYNCAKYQGDETKPKDPYSPSPEYLGDVDKDGKLTYAEAHPEWYNMRGGKREAHKHKKFHGNFCTSNLDATHELAKNLVQCLIDGQWSHADMINFYMLDSGVYNSAWCRCQACRKLGTPTDRLLLLINHVSLQIQKARQQGRLQRNVPLVSLAYHETLPPPTRPLPENFDYDNVAMTFFPIKRCYAHPFADPSCTECNQLFLKDYQGWSADLGSYYKGAMFIGEYYNVSNIKSLPVVYPTIMAVDIPWYYRNGAKHFHYMHTPLRLWGTWTLNQYLMARLLWNTDADADAILDDYFTRYYPTTTDHTRAFYHHLEQATAIIKPLKHYLRFKSGPRSQYTLRFGFTLEDYELYPTKHLRYESYHPLTNDGPDIVDMVKSLQLARTKIDAALRVCADPIEKARLIEDERRFAYGEAMFMFHYHLLRTTVFHRQGKKELARKEFIKVDHQADLLRNIVDLVQVAYRHANAKNGYEASYAQGAYELYQKLYGTKPDVKTNK